MRICAADRRLKMPRVVVVQPEDEVMSKTTIDTSAKGAQTDNPELRICRVQPNDVGICVDDSVTDMVRKLKGKLEDYHRRQARRAGWSRQFVPTGLTPLDAVLPHNGLPCGAITEIFSNSLGVGSMALAMRIAYQCITRERHSNVAESLYSDPGQVGRISSASAPTIPPSRGGAEGGSDDHRRIVLIDTTKDFYPPAAWQYGITLDRLVVIRPANVKETFWATEQVLRCSGVAAVIASLGHLEEHLSRRLQLAAESSGCVGLLLRPTSRRVKSFAAIQMLVEGVDYNTLKTNTQTINRAAGGTSPAARRGSLGGETISDNAPTTYDTPPGLKPATPHRVSTPVAADDVRLCRITVLKVREGMPAEPLLVDLYHETGTWPLHPIPVDRPATKLA